MLKKLQNLLFEDEDADMMDDEVDETSSMSIPVIHEEPETARVEVKPPVVETPSYIQEDSSNGSSMQRIDVTQPVSFPKEPEVKKPETSVFREESPKINMNIRADEEVKKPAKVETPVQQPKTQKTSKPSRPSRPSYEFQPVISPIFGVDEKDMDALKTTTSKISKREKEKQDENISPIISPMYGMDADDSPSLIQNTVAKSDMMEDITGKEESRANEDEIPEFSLDDILKVRDAEYADDSRDDDGILFPDLSFREEEDEPVDETIVMEKPGFTAGNKED